MPGEERGGDGGRKTHVGEFRVEGSCLFGDEARQAIGAAAHAADAAVGQPIQLFASFTEGSRYHYMVLGTDGVALATGHVVGGAWSTEQAHHRADHRSATTTSVLLPPPGRTGSPVVSSRGAGGSTSVVQHIGTLSTFGMFPDPVQAFCLAGVGSSAELRAVDAEMVQFTGAAPWQAAALTVIGRAGAAFAYAERALGCHEDDHTRVTQAIDAVPWSVWATCDWPDVRSAGVTATPGWWRF